MRIVIHAGMHKTGTSSVQDYFHAQSPPQVAYPDWLEANHCGLFILLFQEPELLASYHGFRARGPEFIETLPALRAENFARLSAFLDDNRHRTVLISAEDISSPEFRTAVVRMRDFLSQWTQDIEVIVYARSALDFAVSAFQQNIKDGGMCSLDLDPLWPYFEDRIGGLDKIFGRDRVTVRLYDRECLKDGDIVADFFDALRLPPPAGRRPESNTALSAEATGLLLLQRKMGLGYVSGYDKAQSANNRFIDLVSEIGSHRLTFSEALWKPVADSHATDQAWMDQRLGSVLSSRKKPGAAPTIEIGSEQDLLLVALSSASDLERVLSREIERTSADTLNRIVRGLEMLRVLASLE